MWLAQFPEDFMEPPNFPCLSHFESFCRRVMPGSELDVKVRQLLVAESKDETLALRFPPAVVRSSAGDVLLFSSLPPQVQRKGLHLRKEATIRDSSLIQNLLDSSSSVSGHRQLLLLTPHRPK